MIMLKFICKSVFTCPEGAKTGESYSTFTDQSELEIWLREGKANGYEYKTLVGCELIEEENENRETRTAQKAKAPED